MGEKENYSAPNELPERTIQKVLTGQTAVVTGASKGIGRGIAIALAAAGADVLINYFSDEQGAKNVSEKIVAAGRKCIIHQGDISRENIVKEMFGSAVKTFGRVDILINNAGIQLNAPFDEMSLADWQRVIDVNLTGQFLCAREAVRHFKTRPIDTNISYSLGKIICISSVHDIIPWAGHVNYASAKGGVMLLMKSIAQEVSPLKIRVNGLSPGAIRTPMNDEKLNSPVAYEEMVRLIPYKRIGEIEDCGRAAVWLASDDSEYVQGITLYVDGGMTLYPEFAGGG